MTTQEFEIKYNEKGGIEKLKELRVMQFSKNYIARYFGVTANAVHQWNWMFFGNGSGIAEPVIVKAGMVEFARTNPLAEFRFAFKGGVFYKEVLPIVIKDIYGQ